MDFTKMQGAGNDFIVINNIKQKLDPALFPDMARRFCQRGNSVGADGFMALDVPEEDGDFRMRFYNADGSIAEMCGNGARCIARYAFEEGVAKEEMLIETVAGYVSGSRIDKRKYKILLNLPTLINLNETLALDGKNHNYSYIELGNPGIPHIIYQYENLANADESELRKLGKQLRYHPIFPKGTNVNFYDFGDNDIIIEKTYERGVEDFTLACGTGTGAVALALFLDDIVKTPKIDFSVPGGELSIEIKYINNNVEELALIGPTNIVSYGKIIDEDYF